MGTLRARKTRWISTPFVVAMAMATAVQVEGVGQQPPQTAVTIQHRLEPASVLRSNKAQLVLSLLVSGQSLQSATLELTSPRGITISHQQEHHPSSTNRDTLLRISLPEIQSRFTEAFSIIVDGKVLQRGTHTVVARVTSAGRASVLTTEEIKVEYTPTQSARSFLLTSLLGILLGYAVRLVLQVQKTMQAPAPAPAGSQGRVTQFVKEHYYLVDVFVTVVIGLVVASTMLKDGTPPNAAALGYQSFAIGFGLGVLTNSELITRTRVG